MYYKNSKENKNYKSDKSMRQEADNTNVKKPEIEELVERTINVAKLLGLDEPDWFRRFKEIKTGEYQPEKSLKSQLFTLTNRSPDVRPLEQKTDNTYVEKPRIEEPVERTVNGVKWSELDFKTRIRNSGNRRNGYPQEQGLKIVSPEFDILTGVRGITNLLPKTQTFYHGSPVRFNKFNTQFIGSGEGGSKAMKGINLWPDNHFGAAPKFANIRSSDAPLHLGRASKEISGELNPTIYKVRGRNLNIYSSNTSKGLDQQELVNLGYDGFSNGKQYTIFPESVHKLKIKKHYSIPEFIKAHKKIDSWAPWSTDINKMNNILELAGSSKRF